jgi:hypothetical protein
MLLASLTAMAQTSPHGSDFKVSCSDCHSSKSWALDKSIYSFDHNATAFPLEAKHADANCKACHPTLVFSDAKSKSNCIDCHSDMHEQTLGTDCSRCHTPRSWIIENVSEMHQRSRFPLVGKHAVTDCYNCHKSVSLLRFDPLGVECYDCHNADYAATTNPNHVQSNFAKTCADCHLENKFAWTGASINHSFFPLTGGHDISDCSKCHKNGSYSNTPNTCEACHQANYNSTTNPNHSQIGFSTNCIDCHTTNPGWKPAKFTNHDAQFFPIYSGKHNGKWNTCADCHKNASNYSDFTCTDCHEHSNQNEVNNQHEGVGGYSFNSDACYQCHPQGSKEGGFNHNATPFPLTGAHTTTPCASCHTNGYVGTTTDCGVCHLSNYNQSVNPNHVTANIPKDCGTCHTTVPGWKPATFTIHNQYFALDGGHASVECITCHTNGNYATTPNTCAGCHINNYNQTVNPNHTTLNLSTDCATCHTTNPGWKPATFAVHDTYYVLQGAHLSVACNTCHTSGYPNTPNTCYGCHAANYNQTNNPNHVSAQFSTDCASCHSQIAWTPSTFNHDAQYFPIYSGKHKNKWTTCADCHTNSSNYADFTCTTSCHPQSTMNNQHQGISGYAYNSPACLSCHPDGSTAGAFNHSTSFPLTAGHANVDCSACHANGYAGTSNVCSTCHINNYNQTTNPNHVSLGLSTDCSSCHTTNPGWNPATFAVHNNYYVLAGAHINAACNLCHTNGNYTNEPTTCVGCHQNDYNQTTDPAHASAQFPTDCETCHTQTAWVPSTFNHDGMYFPIYSGNHKNKWNTCADCHTNPSNYAVFTCVTSSCHGNAHHQNQGSTGCYSCHPNGSGGKSLDNMNNMIEPKQAN